MQTIDCDLSAKVQKVRFPDDESINMAARDTLNSAEYVKLPASVTDYIDLSVQICNSEIGVSENPALRDVVVKVQTTQGGNLSDQCMRAALDLVCIVDISGSMIGFNPDGTRGNNGKIDKLKVTLVKMLNFLTDADRFSLVFFNSKAKRATPLIPTNQENKAKLKTLIENVEAGGSTNIFDALITGLSILDSRREKNQVASVFLLSDGCDKLSMETLQKSFSVQAKGYQDHFSEISINTFGFGEDDYNFMELIAHKTGGIFYNVEEYEHDYTECFAECLGSLLSIIAEKAVLKVKLEPTAAFPEVRFEKIYSETAEKLSEIELKMDYKFLISGMTKHLGIKVHLPQGKNIADWKDKPIKIGSATLTFTNLQTKDSLSLPTQDVIVNIKDAPATTKNAEVERQILRMEFISFQRNQISLIEKGKIEEAKEREKQFAQANAQKLAAQKQDQMISNCYAQYNAAQSYIHNYSNQTAVQNESHKRRLMMGRFAQENECSNIQTRFYSNSMQQNFIAKCKK